MEISIVVCTLSYGLDCTPPASSGPAASCKLGQGTAAMSKHMHLDVHVGPSRNAKQKQHS